MHMQKLNVNTVVISGRPLLHHAADYGQYEVIEYLIQQGADVNVSHCIISLPLFDTCLLSLCQALDKHGISPLLAAILEGHTECVRLLIAKGAKTDGRSPDGQSYLEAAEKDEIKSLLTA